ncbi:5-carboxymethyl-2-hydroxymuconate Delta-isomerase [Fervidibacillus halotolerans]|uniref:5-carboxymethyl-2-hydroxymuconate Delta-isomerase n=1 Tax=Fervidibacillus halotolerans TaxID=2980027 RepID=A0A9E8RZ16_9BACI|nr:5-carboxymethyl-2-hydroxymuconate Delta-isomerase [Fervidibacillus halotolerans]WAA13426.1 5-carboxymethyl-2-hydroxymuconate Delta-isomerase [Fervidibacillus halotolerans]
MPHFILEYTDNIKEEANIPTLLKKVNTTLLTFSNIVPIGGLRSRAIELKDYVIADGTEDDAFIHATLKIGKGRTEKERKQIADAVFAVMKKHLQDVYERRSLAVSMEVYEFIYPTYKWNNIHSRYQDQN